MALRLVTLLALLLGLVELERQATVHRSACDAVAAACATEAEAPGEAPDGPPGEPALEGGEEGDDDVDPAWPTVRGARAAASRDAFGLPGPWGVELPSPFDRDGGLFRPS